MTFDYDTMMYMIALCLAWPAGYIAYWILGDN